MRLPRPSIDMRTKLRVLCRQLGEMFPDELVKVAIEQRSLGVFVRDRLARLAALLRCEVTDLHLDHDPALVNREKDVRLPDGTLLRCVVVPVGADVLRYYPDANDPEYLIYRVGGETGSAHDVKTRVRGEHGQHSDLALARKNKRIDKRLRGDKKRPTFRQVTREIEQRYLSKPPRVKRPILSRPFPKGSRPMRRKP